jgi:hypothetical protein
MIAAFDRLERISGHEVAAELDAVVRTTFEETQLLVPADQGDKRRPGGALKASGRATSGLDYDDQWSAAIEYGTEDDRVPYAHWAATEGESDWMAPTRAAEEQITQIIERGFDP